MCYDGAEVNINPCIYIYSKEKSEEIHMYLEFLLQTFLSEGYPLTWLNKAAENGAACVIVVAWSRSEQLGSLTAAGQEAERERAVRALL